MPYFEGRLSGGVEHLGGALNCRKATSINEFLRDSRLDGLNCRMSRGKGDLQEHLSKDAIRLFSEDGGEDDCDTIWGGLDVDYLLVTIVHCHEISLS